MGEASCPFCHPAPERLFYQGRLVVGLWDAYPVSPGHALLVPRRHFASWWDASPDEQLELLSAIAAARAAILQRHQPDGFNIGINVGEAAGQTIFHLHVHVIPRYRDDVADPRGGVRHVIPSRAAYPSSASEGAASSRPGGGATCEPAVKADPSAPPGVTFGSEGAVARNHHLERFASDTFDYIVVDEFHHACARSYRRLIDHFRPKFLLGLTATPERTDGGDLLALCQENLVYRRDLLDGIRLGLLCPFRYFGVPDDVDYANIPWRNSRFDEEALTAAVATRARAANALGEYRKRAGARTLAFCVSQRHADFMADYFRDAGVRAAAVHAGDASAPRAASLERLAGGGLDIVFAVDMFNEGVDLPALDTVMMLRPTESRIVWLQQFGRGLRTAPGKDALTVVDYIGNHRTFLLKPQTLFNLGPGRQHVLNLLERLDEKNAELPPGCNVTYELEAVNILRALAATGTAGALAALRQRYEDFKELHDVRPTATEMYHEGYDPRAVRRRKAYASWLLFANAMGVGHLRPRRRCLKNEHDTGGNPTSRPLAPPPTRRSANACSRSLGTRRPSRSAPGAIPSRRFSARSRRCSFATSSRSTTRQSSSTSCRWSRGGQM